MPFTVVTDVFIQCYCTQRTWESQRSEEALDARLQPMLDGD